MADLLFDFGIDPVTGLRCAGYEEDGQTIIVNEQPGDAVQKHLDVTSSVAEVARQRLTQRGSNGGVAASIPPLLHWKWRREWEAGPKQWGLKWSGIGDSFLHRKLNSSEYKHLRYAKL